MTKYQHLKSHCDIDYFDMYMKQWSKWPFFMLSDLNNMPKFDTSTIHSIQNQLRPVLLYSMDFKCHIRSQNYVTHSNVFGLTERLLNHTIYNNLSQYFCGCSKKHRGNKSTFRYLLCLENRIVACKSSMKPQSPLKIPPFTTYMYVRSTKNIFQEIKIDRCDF